MTGGAGETTPRDATHVVVQTAIPAGMVGVPTTAAPAVATVAPAASVPTVAVQTLPHAELQMIAKVWVKRVMKTMNRSIMIFLSRLGLH